MAIRPGFEATSQQQAGHAQKRSCLINVKSFPGTQKSEKKGSATRIAQGPALGCWLY